MCFLFAANFQLGIEKKKISGHEARNYIKIITIFYRWTFSIVQAAITNNGRDAAFMEHEKDEQRQR